MDCSPPGSSAHGILQGKNTGVGCHGALPDTGIEPASLMSPALAERFFTISTTWEVLPGVVLSYTKPDLCPSWKDKSGDACLTFHNHCGKNTFFGSNTRYMTTESNTHTCASMLFEFWSVCLEEVNETFECLVENKEENIDNGICWECMSMEWMSESEKDQCFRIPLETWNVYTSVLNSGHWMETTVKAGVVNFSSW